MRRRFLSRALPAAIAALLLLPGAATGGWAPPPSDICAAGAGAAARTGRPILLEGIGAYHHRVSTRSPLAQRYFDQGLVLAWGFNMGEAERSFREAARLDPQCAMCYWGIAYALGPTINSDMDARALREAQRAMLQAQSLARQATQRERAYIAALSTRYAPAPGRDREDLDQRYAEATGRLSARFPDDPDAAVLHADALMNLHPWDYWDADGTPRPWTPQIVDILERVLATAPDHPGANHFYIHALEASPHPEKALPSAERIVTLAPGAGHLVHMAAHIYLRVGRYHDVSVANQKAIEADLAYLARSKADPAYTVGYVAHNYHFLWFSLAMEGRGAEAAAVAAKLAGQVDATRLRLPRHAILQQFRALPYFNAVRFGRWQEMLALPRPAPDSAYELGVWHYARGVAQARLGRNDDARRELGQLERVSSRRELERYRLKGINPLATLLAIASHLLRGEIALAEGNQAMALDQFGRAAAAEDGLEEDEPPAWPLPTRYYLGAGLLASGQAAAAEQVYRADLKRYPENGWSLASLADSLARQGKADAARDAEARFRRAWSHADLAAPELPAAYRK
jgi:predicted Zn-dependent protease